MGELVSLPNSGRKQCRGTARSTQQRCTITAQPDSEYCWRHDPTKVDESRIKANGTPLTTAQKLEAAKQQVMDLVPAAMEALVSILNDPLTKPSDRLKAIEMVMNRAVAQKIEADVSNSDVRDIDAEIDEVLAEVAEDLRTGTDG